ncbi:hypothetical protein HYV64_04380 [Candidatus Shapirobacteria bacterium]|nr:hypothetical protein [Candidatus Shapirobacteria bacterium]
MSEQLQKWIEQHRLAQELAQTQRQDLAAIAKVKTDNIKLFQPRNPEKRVAVTKSESTSKP